MTEDPRSPPLGIAAVERETGLAKETLRVWERRYGFPAPARDDAGERLYSRAQVDRLRLLRRLLDAGHRPGRVVRLPDEALRSMVDAIGASPDDMPTSPSEDLEAYERLVRTHRADELRSVLSHAAVRLGLERFVSEVCAPLNRLIGDAWARGRLEIFEEHLYTESVQGVLRAAIGSIPRRDERPRVLLTTFPDESHGLGLLMAESVMVVHGAQCLSLGTETPVRDIVLAARAHRSDIVALSFSPCLGTSQIETGLAELRSMLSGPVEIWAGGAHPGLGRRPLDGVHVLDGLGSIPRQIERWRGGTAV